MKIPYLIQRGRLKDPPQSHRKGIDAFIHFSYMGSSEFEWGALPESLRRMRSSPLKAIKYIFEDKVFFVVLREYDEKDLLHYFKLLSRPEVRCKEPAWFADFLAGAPLHDETDFWWDIENDIMFWDESHPQSEMLIEEVHGGVHKDYLRPPISPNPNTDT